jgi:hypothetical protein
MQSLRAFSSRVSLVLWAICMTAYLLAVCAAHAQTTQADHADEKKLSGVGVIIRVDASAPQPVFEADGYRIRVGPSTVTAFSDPLKTLADVGPNTWLRFEGTLDQAGVLVATKAEFFPAGYRKNFTSMGPRKVKPPEDYKPIMKDALIDAEGHFVNAHTKVRYSDAGGACGWHRVPADHPLQERVERIGMRLVPAYQKALPADNPSRIPFRFYVVADDKARGVSACNWGLVLVPKNAVERLKNDDQLAAVLADGVAFNLQRQLFTMGPLEWSALGAELVMVAPLGLGGYLGDTAAEFALKYEIALKLGLQRARITLQLLADAGYDPKQAPEAWRLLEPKELPSDVASLKYTREGEYQLRLLKLMYKDAAPDPVAPSPASGSVPAASTDSPKL